MFSQTRDISMNIYNLSPLISIVVETSELQFGIQSTSSILRWNLLLKPSPNCYTNEIIILNCVFLRLFYNQNLIIKFKQKWNINV